MAENEIFPAQPADGSLTRAALAGGAWTLASNVMTKVLGGLKTVVLARLLLPGDFGLIGLALAVISSINFFSNPGSYSALIQKRNLEDEDLNAGWWIHFVRGNMIFIALIVLAPLLALFFREPRLAKVLRVVSLSVLFDAVQSIGMVRLNRSLDFRRLTWLQQVANLASFVVAVVLAWSLRSVWALVGAHVAYAGVLCIASYAVQPFRPRMRLDWGRVRHLLRFGRYLLAATFFYFLINRGNEFLLSRMVGVERYGYYALAITLLGIVTGPLEQVVHSVAFPALSRIEREDERFASAFSRVFRMAAMLSVALFGAMTVFGRDAVPLVLGRKWLPMTEFVSWLGVFGFFQTLTTTFQVAHSALGRVERQAALRGAEFGVYALGAVPAIHYGGAAGAAFWLASSAAAGFLIHVYGTLPTLRPVFRYSAGDILAYWPLFLLQAALAAFLWTGPAGWLRLIAACAVYTAAVVGFMWRKEKVLILDLLNVAGIRG